MNEMTGYPVWRSAEIRFAREMEAVSAIPEMQIGDCEATDAERLWNRSRAASVSLRGGGAVPGPRLSQTAITPQGSPLKNSGGTST